MEEETNKQTEQPEQEIIACTPIVCTLCKTANSEIVGLLNTLPLQSIIVRCAQCHNTSSLLIAQTIETPELPEPPKEKKVSYT